jgi:rubrerythrin
VNERYHYTRGEALPLQPNWNAPYFDAIVLPPASSSGPESRAEKEEQIISQIEQEQIKARARDVRKFASLDNKIDKTVTIMTDQVERIAYDPLIPILSHVETRTDCNWRCIECGYMNIDNNAICKSCGQTTAPPQPTKNT